MTMNLKISAKERLPIFFSGMFVNPKTVFAVFVKHILGSINYCAVNVLYDSKANWREVEVDKVPSFRKSIFVAFLAFTSCWLVILPLLWVAYSNYQKKAIAGKLDPKESPYQWRKALLLVIPSVMDYVAVTLSLTGNKYILASLVVSIKALRIFLSTLLSAKFLKRTYYAYHWLGIFMVVPGIVCVGVSQQLNGTKKKLVKMEVFMPYVGMALVVTAEFLRAAKSIYEEKLLQTVRLCPRFVSVIEGAICSLLAFLGIIAFHIAPGDECDVVGAVCPPGSGSFENVWNTLEWLNNSTRVQIWVTWMVFTTGFITFAGFLVIKYLSAVHNALWSEVRVIIVWGCELCIGAALDGEGTKWMKYSWLTLIGFQFIILCGLIFNKTYILPIPWLYSAELKKIEEDKASSVEACTGDVSLSGENYDDYTSPYRLDKEGNTGTVKG
jgi:uncharacterized membrane protein